MEAARLTQQVAEIEVGRRIGQLHPNGLLECPNGFLETAKRAQRIAEFQEQRRMLRSVRERIAQHQFSVGRAPLLAQGEAKNQPAFDTCACALEGPAKRDDCALRGERASMPVAASFAS